MDSTLILVSPRIIPFQISNITCKSLNETCYPMILLWTKISAKIKIQVNIASMFAGCTVPNCLLSSTEANKKPCEQDRTKSISANCTILLGRRSMFPKMTTTSANAILRQIPATSTQLTEWLANILKLLGNHLRKRKRRSILKRVKANWIKLSLVSKARIKTAWLDSAIETIQEWAQDRWAQITPKRFSSSCQYWRKLKKRFNWRRPSNKSLIKRA